MARATAVIGGSSVLASGIGFSKNLLAAYYFGTSGEMDAYLVALLVPDTIIALARAGVLNFIPVFAAVRARSEDEAWSSAGKILALWLLLLLGVLTIAFLLIPYLMPVLAPGFGALQRGRSAGLSRVLLLVAATGGAARLFAVVLLAEKRFLAASGSEILFQIGSILYLVVCSSWGVDALAWSMVFGGCIQLLSVGVALRRHRRRLRADLDIRNPAVRRLVRLLGPVYLGSAGAKVNEVVNRAFASLLPAGAVSSLGYAYVLVEAPSTILATSLTNALFPFLADQFAAEDTARAGKSLGRAMVALSLLFFPLAVGMLVLAEPLVRLLLERGTFDARSTVLTASALRLYTPCVVALALNEVLAATFNARQDTATPMKIGFVRVATNAALCTLLVPHLGHRGVALALSLAEWVKLLLLLYLVRRLFPAGEIRATLRSLVGFLPAVGTMGVLVHLAASQGLAERIRWGGTGLAVFAGLVLLGALSYAAALRLFSREEFAYHAGFLKGGLGRVSARLGFLTKGRGQG